MTVIRRTLQTLLVAGLLLLPCFGQGISVSGAGKASAKTVTATVSAEVSASAKSALDAMARYESKLKRLIKGIKVLELAKTETVRSHPRLGEKQRSNRDFGDMHSQGPKLYSVSEGLKIRVGSFGDLDTSQKSQCLATIIDGIQEAGASLGANSDISRHSVFVLPSGHDDSSKAKGESGPIQYGVASPSTVESEALSAAISDAREQAEAIAKLGGIKLGRILEVTATQPHRWARKMESCSCSLSVRVRFEIAQ